jgi:hypothetical protein
MIGDGCVAVGAAIEPDFNGFGRLDGRAQSQEVSAFE